MQDKQRAAAQTAAADIRVVQRFRFAFDQQYRGVARLFGVRDSTANVEVGPVSITCTFGPWTVSSPLENISQVSVTGPYGFLKTVGPARLSLADKGITFATNGQRGVFIEFRVPVKGIDPFGVVRHPNLTVTVADCEGLMSALRTERSTSDDLT